MKRVRLGPMLRLHDHHASNVWREIGAVGGVADIYLMPNLVLAILAPDRPAPILDGLAGNWLGRFTTKLSSRELGDALNETIAQECPGDQLYADEVDAPDERLSAVTHPGGILSRVVEFGEHSGTIKAIGAALGIPRTTLIERLKKWPDIPLDKLFSKKVERMDVRREKDAEPCDA